MKEHTIQAAMQHLSSKPDDELTEIWRIHDAELWSPEGFEAVKRILEKRGVAVPTIGSPAPQRVMPPPAHSEAAEQEPHPLAWQWPSNDKLSALALHGVIAAIMFSCMMNMTSTGAIWAGASSGFFASFIAAPIYKCLPARLDGKKLAKGVSITLLIAAVIITFVGLAILDWAQKHK